MIKKLEQNFDLTEEEFCMLNDGCIDENSILGRKLLDRGLINITEDQMGIVWAGVTSKGWMAVNLFRKKHSNEIE